VSVYDLYQSYLNQIKGDVTQSPVVTDPNYLLYLQQQAQSANQNGGEGPYDPTNTIGTGSSAGITSLSDAFGFAKDNFGTIASSALFGLGPTMIGKGIGALIGNIRDPNTDIFGRLNEVGLAAQARNMAQARGITKGLDADAARQGITGFTGYGTSQQRGAAMHDAGGGGKSGGSNDSGESGYGGFCFDPNTPVQMADGSEKKIKNIQLGDETKGGEVTGVFQFKAADEIHDYKGVTVAGSHYVKENGKFIMVKDSPVAVKIDKIPVVYSLDTSGRRIFIKDIEFADYNGDGIAKNFLNNAGVDLSGFDKEVLRQVENRIL